MSIVNQILKNKLLIVFVTLILLFSGGISYSKLTRVDSPVATNKVAVITTYYPGASPLEVENEVTEFLESALKEFYVVDTISSVSGEGKSIITLHLNPSLNKKKIPQAFQTIKDKVNDLQNSLPPHIEKSIVNTDINEVYGVLLAITGNGFTDTELRRYTDLLKQKLSIIPGVEKIIPWGIQTESIDIYLPQIQLTQLGISENKIYSKLKNKNLVASAGKVVIDHQDIHLRPISTINPIDEIGNVVVKNQSNQIIHLNDIANISNGYSQPTTIMRQNGRPAIGLAISTNHKNIIQIGKLIKQKIAEVEKIVPTGVEIETIFFQPDNIAKATTLFDKTWIISFIFILITLLLTMGMRSGLLQGIAALLTLSTTMILLYWMNIELQPITFGAIIISLCLFIDNNILINKGILNALRNGEDNVNSAIEVVKKNSWPLLCGTLICILTLVPLSLSHTIAAQYTHSLFTVIFISLLMGWLISVTMTPALCIMFLKNNSSPLFSLTARTSKWYEKTLRLALTHRIATLSVILLLFILAFVGLSFSNQSFFPYSERSQFMIHYWLPQGSQIELTNQHLQGIENHLAKNDNIHSISTFVGAGAPKFLANYIPENPNPSYGLQIINVKKHQNINSLISQVKNYIIENYPDAKANIEKFTLGPHTSNAINVRFSGEDPIVLRQLADQAMDIYQQSQGMNIQTNWRNQVPVIHSDIDEVSARASGITKKNIANALEEAFTGRKIGIYQDQKTIMPIIAHRTFNDKVGFDNLYDIMIWSPVAQKSISIQQVIKGIEMDWENPFLFRHSQIRSIEAQSHYQELTNQLLNTIQPKIEKIKLPHGYTLAWDGEFVDAKKSKMQLLQALPFIGIAIIFILILLFNSLRLPFIILLCVPVTIIGVTFGLWVTQTSFGFMPFVGIFVLCGIIIKSAIIFMQKTEKFQNKNIEDIVLFFSSKIGSLSLTSLTICLGLLPLLSNDLFRGMTITLLFGILITAIIISILLPILYSLFSDNKYYHPLLK